MNDPIVTRLRAMPVRREGYTLREIAEASGLSLKTVHRIQQRAMQKLAHAVHRDPLVMDEIREKMSISPEYKVNCNRYYYDYR